MSKVGDKKNKYLDKLDDDGYAKPTNEKHLVQIIRSAVRKAWMRSDVKLAFLFSRREDDTSNMRRKFKYRCDKCHNYFAQADVEVDHKSGHKEFTLLSQALDWARSILDVSAFKDLQLLCKPDHATKSYCEANGLDWEDPEQWLEGEIQKEAIAICKGSGCPEKKWLLSRGMSEGEIPKNKQDRRQMVVNILRNDKCNTQGDNSPF